MIVEVGVSHGAHSIEELKRLIDDESYLADAIRRIAQVLSDELIGVRIPGATNERDR